VRPLYQLWRDGQTRQLQLVDERARYAKLQQSSDSELETLRQQEQRCAAAGADHPQAGKPDRYRTPALQPQAGGNFGRSERRR
jgi:hypothetical protein